jgi:hypothetical protein
MRVKALVGEPWNFVDFNNGSAEIHGRIIAEGEKVLIIECEPFVPREGGSEYTMIMATDRYVYKGKLSLSHRLRRGENIVCSTLHLLNGKPITVNDLVVDFSQHRDWEGMILGLRAIPEE